MYKKAPKEIFSKKKSSTQQLPQLKVLNFDDEFSSKSAKSKNKSKERNVNIEKSSSWGRQDSETSALCSNEIEHLSTEKIIKQWKIIEDILYDKKNQPDYSRILYEECLQWQSQLPHLRILGNNYQQKQEEDAKKSEDDSEEEDDLRNNLCLERRRSSQLEIIEPTKLTVQNRRQIREYVFDNLLEYICSELIYYQQEIEENKLNNEFEEYLKLNSFNEITEIPYLNNESLVSENNIDDMQLAVGNDKKNVTVSQSENTDNDDIVESEDNFLATGRPKPGMIFCEKIVVSPVPCPISTRESFTTMKINPMQLIGRPVEFSTNREYLSQSSLYSSSRPTSIHSHSKSGWRYPNNYTPLPQNVKLAPIELPAMPNKKRSITAITYNRPRISLNPMSSSEILKKKKQKNLSDGIMQSDNLELLNVQGARISTNNKPKHVQQRLQIK